MNEGPADIGAESNPSDPHKPLLGVPLPVTGIVAFIDQTWNKKLSSSAGYSYVNIKNTVASDASSFKSGNYAVANIIYSPLPNMMAAMEVQYGRRDNFTDGFNSSATRIQFSFKYNFSHCIF